MDVRASLRFFRMSPRKVRLLTNLLQGLPVAKAEAQLNLIDKAAALPLKKLLRSAIANAKNNFQIAEDGLYIKQCLTNEGPKLRRFTPKAFGRGAPIMRRSSHVTLVLSQRDQPKIPKPAANAKTPSTKTDPKATT